MEDMLSTKSLNRNIVECKVILWIGGIIYGRVKRET